MELDQAVDDGKKVLQAVIAKLRAVGKAKATETDKKFGKDWQQAVVKNMARKQLGYLKQAHATAKELAAEQDRILQVFDLSPLTVQERNFFETMTPSSASSSSRRPGRSSSTPPT